jgi:hypothetical protein
MDINDPDLPDIEVFESFERRELLDKPHAHTYIVVVIKELIQGAGSGVLIIIVASRANRGVLTIILA